MLFARRLHAPLVALLGIACAPPPQSNGLPANPRQAAASRCQVGATQTSVLVTEWSAAEKANLEALLRGGAVAAEYTGCQMRLLPQCRLPGQYYWQRTTATTDIVEIRSEEELYAKVPLGALELSAELARSGSLAIETTVAGQQRLYGADATYVPNSAECEFATHLIGAASLGAFALSAGNEISGGVGASVHIAEAGVRASSSRRIIRYAGDPRSCTMSDDRAAAHGCSSPVQLFLEPIPGRAEVPGPPGSVKVDFRSGSAAARWDVYINDQATCTTPCASYVDPNAPVLLRTRKDRPDRLLVSNLAGATGPVQVVSYPTSRGKQTVGITFTALGGMSLAAGIALTAVGYARDSEGMKTAGLINIFAGGAITATSIWLILDSLPKYRINPLFGSSMSISPGGVSGQF